MYLVMTFLDIVFSGVSSVEIFWRCQLTIYIHIIPTLVQEICIKLGGGGEKKNIPNQNSMRNFYH